MPSTTSPDGTRIAYDVTGDGPPLIVVGGAFNHRGFGVGAKLAELLGDRFRVINYDRRGRGDSTDTAPYSVQREIEDLAALVDVAGGSAALFGTSSGAVLAMRAVAAGVPVTHVVAHEPPFLVDDSRPPLAPELMAALRTYGETGDRSAATRTFLADVAGVPRPALRLMRVTPIWRRLTATADTLYRDVQLLGDSVAGRPLRPQEWSGVTCPTLVLHGTRSGRQLQAAAEALAGALPDAQLGVLEGQSHNVSAKALVAPLSAFLSAAPPPERPDALCALT